jgi:hypothetical protein
MRFGLRTRLCIAAAATINELFAIKKLIELDEKVFVFSRSECE